MNKYRSLTTYLALLAAIPFAHAAALAGVPQQKKYIEGGGTDMGHIALGSIFGRGVANQL